MATKNIECEIRAEIVGNFDDILKHLQDKAVFISQIRRLSVMYFGKANNQEIDARVRITNGEAELALKIGSLHAHDREEIIQPINPPDFIRFVRIFCAMQFDGIQIAERETYNFNYGNEVIISLVKAGEIAYLEIEKMVNENEIENTKIELEKIAVQMGVKILKDKSEFDDLCQRLTQSVDWGFDKSEKHYQRLQDLLNVYSKIK